MRYGVDPSYEFVTTDLLCATVLGRPARADLSVVFGARAGACARGLITTWTYTHPGPDRLPAGATGFTSAAWRPAANTR